MKIREYAKSVGFEIVGKLTRRPEWEYTTDNFTGKKRSTAVLGTTPTRAATST